MTGSALKSVWWPGVPGGINGCQVIVFSLRERRGGLWLPDLRGLTRSPDVTVQAGAE